MSGWLYISDDGIEWSANHPVHSGEVPDARQIRRATNAELLAALKDAWEAHGESIQSEGRLRQRWQAAEDALRAATASPAIANLHRLEDQEALSWKSDAGELFLKLRALREALERIEAAPAWGAPDRWEVTPSEVRQIARTALSALEGGGEEQGSSVARANMTPPSGASAGSLQVGKED